MSMRMVVVASFAPSIRRIPVCRQDLGFTVSPTSTHFLPLAVRHHRPVAVLQPVSVGWQQQQQHWNMLQLQGQATPRNDPSDGKLTATTTTGSSSVVVVDEGPIESSSSSTNNSEDEEIIIKDDPLLANAEYMTLSLLPHRPLGCTVEESLPDGQHVFISKVTPDGNAAKAGLQVGDVIVGCSDFFGTALVSLLSLPAATAVVGSSRLDRKMETVLQLIRARPDHEALELRIARGCTAVMEQHEQALVELCSNPDNGNSGMTSEIENCMLEYWKQSYGDTVDDGNTSRVDQCDEEDDNCALDSVFDLWNQDLEGMTTPSSSIRPQPFSRDETNKNNNVVAAINNTPKVKPWSSRSSPSGTFVRDPKTGKMKNVDV
ncbi:hypothetical protein ACA910_008142 [Epithemia clementina (nom. ined.)]